MDHSESSASFLCRCGRQSAVRCILRFGADKKRCSVANVEALGRTASCSAVGMRREIPSGWGFQAWYLCHEVSWYLCVICSNVLISAARSALNNTLHVSSVGTCNARISPVVFLWLTCHTAIFNDTIAKTWFFRGLINTLTFISPVRRDADND